ncbi:hypothetical protein AMK59_3906 [Oryctes borbonicus]|uniref:NodB homology domain-containing protein n=1 Tax=Oryctes borbonicus TaxID=1629725 RepID=A0A0T6B805_9SCAR|nr:hypothetical protein AMK59_3906 [Oryctes borbonicus]
MVNSLYNLGLEIGVHSISRNNLDSYWQEASYDTLLEEFDGQRQILARFANIPIEDVVGGKMPNLYMRGNDMIEAFQDAGLEYDNTQITRSNSRYFPYTLDYVSGVGCAIGECPTESYPGFWELPVVDMVGAGGIECNSLQGCGITGTSSEIRDWLMEQFQRVYGDNKAPITLVVSSGWLGASTSNLEGLTLFLDQLKTLNDVYLVSHKQVVDWMKNPVGVSAFKTDEYYREQRCVARSCALNKDGAERYMKSCVACPANYPWLGNPLGQ